MDGISDEQEAIDADQDGVGNAADKCANSYRDEKVDADGCGPFRADATFGARTTEDVANGPGVGGQCINPAGTPLRRRDAEAQACGHPGDAAGLPA